MYVEKCMQLVCEGKLLFVSYESPRPKKELPEAQGATQKAAARLHLEPFLSSGVLMTLGWVHVCSPCFLLFLVVSVWVRQLPRH